MCGRFTLHASTRQLAEGLLCGELADFRLEARYNIAPGQWILVVRPENGSRRPGLAQWGLVPSWSKDPAAGPRPINARAEGVADRPAFCGAFRHGRCLIPASGFYEWKAGGPAKQPFYLRPAGGTGFFAFAGLWSVWSGPEGKLSTCAILTVPSNALMAGLHDRMPAILAPEDQAAWLDPENRRAADLLRPFPPEAMEAHAVGPAVGNPRNEGPDLIAPELLPSGLGLEEP